MKLIKQIFDKIKKKENFSILEALEGACIVSFKQKGNNILITEECDTRYYTEIDKEQ